MPDRLIQALISAKNDAADDCLLEALRVGSAPEKTVCLDALIRRGTERGLSGVIAAYDKLPEALQGNVLGEIKKFHHAIRECGRSEDHATRQAALKLIALGRQGKLAYVLLENLHSGEEALSDMAVKSLVALARWVNVESKALNRVSGFGSRVSEEEAAHETRDPRPETRSSSYAELIEQRPEIEAAVSRALDVHRGKNAADLLRAGLLLCDWPGSKTLAILHTAKHGGQSLMVRRLQQPPASEAVESFLLGASHGQLRSHFGIAFSRISEAPVLDALLRKTHWLKDHQLQTCLHHVTRAAWLGEAELMHDIERRTPGDAALIGEWICETGVHDVIQDERMERLRNHAMTDFSARLRLLRIAIRRKRGGSVKLIQAFLTDPDERLIRMAAREIIRRRPADFENHLLQMMTSAPESVRRVISRAIGQVGFDLFWARFDRLDKPTRKQAGRAMLKLLPDAAVRLGRRLAAPDIDGRLKAMQMAQELGLSEHLRGQLLQLCTDANAKVRSKAIHVVGEIPDLPPDALIERLIVDGDARVRANTIEILEAKKKASFLPVLAQRARSANNRERANAIKAMHRMRVQTASSQLLAMMRDERSDHRISALWALGQTGIWQLVNEAVRLAKEDANLKVRRYALGVVKNVVETAQAAKKPVAKAG
jgi:HEAT repeat protein